MPTLASLREGAADAQGARKKGRSAEWPQMQRRQRCTQGALNAKAGDILDAIMQMGSLGKQMVRYLAQCA
jgi:hypothetical protein